MKLKAWDINLKMTIDMKFNDDGVARAIYDTFKSAQNLFAQTSDTARMELRADDDTVVAFCIFGSVKPYAVKDDRTPEELEWSKKAKERLGFDAIVYKDGHWICDPRDLRREIGYGNTPEEAIQDCLDYVTGTKTE